MSATASLRLRTWYFALVTSNHFPCSWLHHFSRSYAGHPHRNDCHWWVFMPLSPSLFPLTLSLSLLHCSPWLSMNGKNILVLPLSNYCWPHYSSFKDPGFFCRVKLVSNWILTFCQPHRIISVWGQDEKKQCFLSIGMACTLLAIIIYCRFTWTTRSHPSPLNLAMFKQPTDCKVPFGERLESVCFWILTSCQPHRFTSGQKDLSVCFRGDKRQLHIIFCTAFNSS